jgi:hypothetical protein
MAGYHSIRPNNADRRELRMIGCDGSQHGMTFPWFALHHLRQESQDIQQFPGLVKSPRFIGSSQPRQIEGTGASGIKDELSIQDSSGEEQHKKRSNGHQGEKRQTRTDANPCNQSPQEQMHQFDPCILNGEAKQALVVNH